MANQNEQFGKIYQRYAELSSESESISRDTRALLAAMGRANNAGHALFDKGELRKLLGKQLSDGTWKEASRATVFQTLAKLRGAGLLLPGGGELCLWLPQEFWQKGVRSADPYCPIHKTRSGGWANPGLPEAV